MRINTILAVSLMLFVTPTLFAQKYITKTGHVSFFSSTPIEDIEAHNRQVNAALDISTGDFVFKILMKSFEFEKALMQEHFNENYVLSDKFPDATFVGKVTNLAAIKFNTPGTYEAMIEGDMTIKGVTKKIKEKGTFIVSKEGINGKSEFSILLADYEVKIPKTVSNQISSTITIKVDVDLKPMAK